MIRLTIPIYIHREIHLRRFSKITDQKQCAKWENKILLYTRNVPIYYCILYACKYNYMSLRNTLFYIAFHTSFENNITHDPSALSKNTCD